MKEFFIPEGHREGLPKVTVSRKVVEILGSVSVDYDGLNELYHEDLQVPKRAVPHLVLRPLKGRYLGQYDLMNGRSLIDPVKIIRHKGSNAIIESLLHEARHQADFINHPILSLGDIAVRNAAAIAGGVLGAKFGIDNTDLPVSIAAGWFGMIVPAHIIHMIGYKYSPLEYNARKTAKDEALKDKYANVIQFSNINFAKSLASPLFAPLEPETA